MRNHLFLLLITHFLALNSYGKGKIQNEDVKSLSEITSSVLSTTGNLTNSNICIASPASVAGLATGQYIYDTTNPTYIQSGTTIVGIPGSCSAGQIQMSQAAAGNATGDTLTFGGQSSQLINDTKIWLTSVTPNQQLSSAIMKGAIGGGNGSKNYLTTYTASTSSGTPNTGNGNFETGANTGWSTVQVAMNGVLPTTTSNPGTALKNNQYIFTVTSANATVGATYTNNGVTFTVVNTIAAQTILVCTASGAPTASGTLTKASGTGDSSITFSAYNYTTPAYMTVAVTTNPILAGNYSGQIGTGANNGIAGTMAITSPFYIDSEDQAKMMTIKFYYQAYGAYSGSQDYSGTSTNTFAIWIYDVTNGAWIMPQGVYNLTQNSGTGLSTATFQTTYNSTQYQLAIVEINALAHPVFLIIDDVSVGPQTAPMGPAMTDWVAYTPTFQGYGTPSAVAFYSRRVGDSLEVKGTFTAGTTSANPNQIGIGFNGTNGNVTVDTTKLPASNIVGHITTSVANSTNLEYEVLAPSSNASYVQASAHTTTQAGNLGGLNGSSIFASSTVIEMFFSVPIVGWSSNTSMSNDTDTRVVAASYWATSNTTASSSSPAIFSGQVFDTHSAFNGATGVFTAPISGYYDVCLFGNISGTANQPIIIYKNGSIYAGVGYAQTSLNANFSYVIKLNAGDYIDIRAGGSVTFVGQTAQNNANPPSVITINRLSGPAVVAATESVSFHANGSTSSFTNSPSILINPTKLFDSHNAYNASTGLFKAPVSGKYAFSAWMVSGYSGSGTSVTGFFYKNGAQYSTAFSGANGTAYPQSNANMLIQLNAGDTVGFYVSANNGSSSAATYSGFTGYRVGN